MMTVVNLYKDKYDVYIGRSGKGQDGYFGNPHTIGWCKICKRKHDRKDSINEFKKGFDNRILNDEEYRKRILSLKDSAVGCFCKPFDCHGDIIKEWLDKNT